MKRRGQLFSLDAMLALVVVILMLGTITSTSSALKSEIEGMISWYGRANIADNMLDVLTKSPGEPNNWYEDPGSLVSLGLADNTTRSLSFEKIKALKESIDKRNPEVLRALEKLALGKDFSMMLINGKWDFNVAYTWDPTKVFGNLSDYQPWPESCEITEATSVELSAPTVVDCKPSLYVNASLHVVSDYSVCIASQITGEGSIRWDIGNYNSASGREGNPGLDEPYLAINGDWPVTAGVTDTVEGDVLVYGAVSIVGSGSGSLYIGGDLYIFGNSEKKPLLDFSPDTVYQLYIGWGAGNLYVKYDGTWYAANASPWDAGSWYKWTGSGWEQVSTDEFNGVILGNIIPSSANAAVTINGYPLPSEWNPPQPPCWNSGLPLEISNVSARFIYPQNFSGTVGSIASGIEFSEDFVKHITIINGSVVEDGRIIKDSLKNSPWVLYAERRTTVSRLKYNSTINISTVNEPKRLLEGALDVILPYYYNLNISVPDENGKYAIFTVIDGSVIKILGVWRTSDTTMGGLWVYNQTVHNVKMVRVYRSIGNSILVSWSDLFSPFSENKGSKMVSLWLYRNTFSWIYLYDLGGIKPLMSERREPFVIKLWVWDDS